MDLIAFISEFGLWSWIVGGLILLAIELIVPGGIFVWLGIAAIATGLFSFIIPMDWTMQWALYGILAIAGVVLWLKYGRKAINTKTDNPFLNKRAQRFFGREVVLETAITQGIGRVKLDDTTWRVTGDDLPKGTMVKVVGAEGAILKIEKV